MRRQTKERWSEGEGRRERRADATNKRQEERSGPGELDNANRACGPLRTIDGLQAGSDRRRRRDNFDQCAAFSSRNERGGSLCSSVQRRRLASVAHGDNLRVSSSSKNAPQGAGETVASGGSRLRRSSGGKWLSSRGGACCLAGCERAAPVRSADNGASEIDHSGKEQGAKELPTRTKGSPLRRERVFLCAHVAGTSGGEQRRYGSVR